MLPIGGRCRRAAVRSDDWHRGAACRPLQRQRHAAGTTGADAVTLMVLLVPESEPLTVSVAVSVWLPAFSAWH